MSTKQTIEIGADFHFYEDLIEESGNVLLEIQGHAVDFNASPDRIILSIPSDIMDKIAEAWMNKRADEVFSEEMPQ